MSPMKYEIWLNFICETLGRYYLVETNSSWYILQAVIDANIIPPLVALLGNAEFDIKKEAAWAISNATSGGTPDQIK